MLGIYYEAQRESPGVVYRVKEEHGEENGKETQGTPFRQWRKVYKRSFPTTMSRWGIERHFAVRETLQQNEVAERMNRTLLEKARCMLSNASISKKIWAEALVYACYLVNRLLFAIGGKTSLKAWSRKMALDYNLLLVFGCRPIVISRKTNWIQERRKVSS